MDELVRNLGDQEITRSDVLSESERSQKEVSAKRLTDLTNLSMDELSVEMSRGTGSIFDGDMANDGLDAEYIGKRETRRVHCWRLILVVFLVSATTLLSTMVYKFTRDMQVEDFESKFDDFALQIIDTVQTAAKFKLEAIGSIALMLQTYALDHNATWPFVTMPYFEEHVLQTQSLTNAYGVYWFPIINSQQERKEWEDYSVANRGWVNKSYATQTAIFGSNYGPVRSPDFAAGETWLDVIWGPEDANDHEPDFSYGISSQIFRTRHEYDPEVTPDPENDRRPKVDTTEPPYFPQWQAASMSNYYQSTVNLNYGGYSDFYASSMILKDTANAVLGEAWTDTEVPGYITTIVFPILKKMFYEEEDEVAAILAIDLFWQDYMSRILPQESGPIDVVVQNDFDQVFTYQVYGEITTFVGDGDLHNTEFNSMVQEFRFGSHLMEPLNGSYTGIPLYGEFGVYDFFIYPTQEMKDQYTTKQPAYYTALVVSVFLFTSLVFIIYDSVVEKRQKKVLSSAVASDNIVSSLFPTDVKRQLYDKQLSGVDGKADGKSKSDKTEDITSIIADELSRSQRRESTIEDVSNEIHMLDQQNETEPSVSSNPNGPPIATLYHKTSILFADIAGFTAWSSNRSPADVFHLLETIYGSFDKAAKKRGVFKVETIGDCYVAATGIPHPRADHAVAMVRFAHEMIQLMEENIHGDLQKALGTDTELLSMRVGIHSGPVTAGVLRGEKARFQLFGDTVNTAARHESTGLPNRIHVSENTARLLIRAGKRHWVIDRETEVFAKGKGNLRTFWVEPDRIPSDSNACQGLLGETDRKAKDDDASHGGSLTHKESEDDSSDTETFDLPLNDESVA